MFTDDKYEKFIELYNIRRFPKYAKANIKEYFDRGVSAFWVMSLLGFVLYEISLFIKGWIALPMIAAGTPLVIAWGIYIARTPSYSGHKNEVKGMLIQFHENDEMNDLMQYLATHYTFENHSLSWRKGLGMTLLSLTIGYVIGSIGTQNKELDHLLISILMQSAIALIAFAYLITILQLYRIDKIVMAMQDIKKFNCDTKAFR